MMDRNIFRKYAKSHFFTVAVPELAVDSNQAVVCTVQPISSFLGPATKIVF